MESRRDKNGKLDVPAPCTAASEGGREAWERIE